jgi:hypothetical protein
MMAALLVAESREEEEEGALYFFGLVVLLFFIFCQNEQGAACGVGERESEHMKAAHFLRGMGERGFQ